MAERAHVTSVEAIKDFRTKLIIYLSKARPTLEEVSSDMMRTRLWLETDQRSHWEREVHHRAQRLEQAEDALFGARMLKLRSGTEVEQMAVRRARAALEQAEAKLRLVRKWSKDFELQVEPLARQLGKLETVLHGDMDRAVAYLAQVIDTLEAYAEVSPASAAAGGAGPAIAPGEGS